MGLSRLFALLLLLAGCVARAADPVDARFGTLWRDAETLDAVLTRAGEVVSLDEPSGPSRNARLLLSAACWPHGRAQVHDLAPWRDVPASQADEFRRTQLLPRMIRLELADGEAVPGLAAAGYRWLVYAGENEGAPRVASDGGALHGPPGAVRVRVLFGLSAQPQPTRVLRHGMALEVLARGVGLEVAAVQWLDARRAPVAHWFRSP